MVTEARKRANAKWDKENMVVLACKVKRETAEQFKAACAAQGTTSNAVLQQAVKAYLEQCQHSAGDLDFVKRFSVIFLNSSGCLQGSPL